MTIKPNIYIDEVKSKFKKVWNENIADRETAWYRLQRSIDTFQPKLCKAVRIARIMDAPKKTVTKVFVSRSGRVIEITEKFHQPSTSNK